METVAVHDGRVKDAWVAVDESTESHTSIASIAPPSSTGVLMITNGIRGVILKLRRSPSNWTYSRERRSLIFIKDLVGYAGAINALEDLYISTAIGCKEVNGETTIVGDWKFTLEGHRIIGISVCREIHLGWQQQEQQ